MTIRRVSILGVAVIALAASCATKPPAAPEPEPQIVAPVQPEPKAPEINRGELDELHSRVVALRKDAFELGLKDSMAQEYASAETRYVAGKTALDKDDRPTAKAELTAAEPLFTDLVAKGAKMVAEQRQSDAGAARGRAVQADSEVYSPDSLALADAHLAKADSLLASGDSKAAIAAYVMAVSAYDAVEKRSMAVAVRDEVDALDYGELDAGNYGIAGQKLDAVEGLLESDPDKAQDNAAEAVLRYNLVLDKGWELTAGSKRDDAGQYKADSEGIKAQVAVKDDYAEAKSVWDKALEVYKSGDHEAALGLFTEAEDLFYMVYQKTLSKKEAADAAIRDAAAKNEQSAEIAASGDEVLNAGGEE
jgi:tetratricopeptide (TPR) repeat protein